MLVFDRVFIDAEAFEAKSGQGVPHLLMSSKEPGDFKTEVHFIGQIVGGSSFQTSIGLFCEVHLEYGEHWKELPVTLEKSIQTQTAYPDSDGFCVWNHPVDLHFAAESMFGWPRFVVRVWRLDDLGIIDLLAYGTAALPCSPGEFRLSCPTWRPIGTENDEKLAFFLRNPPKLAMQDALAKDNRRMMKATSSGVIHIEMEVLLKNFDVHWTRSTINVV